MYGPFLYHSNESSSPNGNEMRNFGEMLRVDCRKFVMMWNWCESWNWINYNYMWHTNKKMWNVQTNFGIEMVRQWEFEWFDHNCADEYKWPKQAIRKSTNAWLIHPMWMFGNFFFFWPRSTNRLVCFSISKCSKCSMQISHMTK